MNNEMMKWTKKWWNKQWNDETLEGLVKSVKYPKCPRCNGIWWNKQWNDEMNKEMMKWTWNNETQEG